MKNGLLAFLVFLAVTSLATVRKADADWATAASTASVDAWMVPGINRPLY